MQRSCEVCGDPFDAQRVTKRYCSTKCRTRASRAGTSGPRAVPAAVVVAVPAPAEAAAPPAKAPVNPDNFVFSATASTIQKLEAADRLDHPLGQVAVILAQRLDASHRDTGSAVASLARQHAAQLALALVGAGKNASPVDKARDDLAERRARAAQRSA